MRTLKKYGYYAAGYGQWLETLGYSPSTVYYNPRMLTEFLQHLEQNKIHSIRQTTPDIIHTYFFQLKKRKHKRRSGTLSNKYINKQLGILKSFNRYLGQVHGITLPIDVDLLQIHQKPIIILTNSEVQHLYQVTDSSALGLRDRAMLGIYYGCGLRRSEGEQLNLDDINTKDNLLLVRKAKNYKQRLVPFTETTKADILNYLHYGRPLLDKGKGKEAFFISRRGDRITSGNLYLRLKQLAEKARIEKRIGLHTLRHSIATHLLQSGMKLEYISRFLGHSSLESTQFYTHIVNEL